MGERVGGTQLRTPEGPPPGGLSGNSKRPGFFTRFVNVVDRSSLPLLASALTFDALLAVIPLAVLVVGGIGLLLDRTGYFGSADPAEMLARFFPGSSNPSEGQSILLMQSLLDGIRSYRGQFTLVATPAFLWFSTRLFGSIRVSLSRIFEIPGAPHRFGIVFAYLLGYVRGKLRDLMTVAVVFGLALVSMVLSGLLALLSNTDSSLVPSWTFLVSTVGQVVGKGVALASGLALFTVLYRYASPKRMAWKGALLAGSVAACAFELAKFLYGLYLARMTGSPRYSLDMNVGAVLLLILWIWYTSLVFLGGAAIAQAWDEGRDHHVVPPLLE